MLVPFILGSDKTTVSVVTGHNEYYPLYGSIGSIQNNIRWAHCGAVALIAFLTIPKSKYIVYHRRRQLINPKQLTSLIQTMQSFANSEDNSFIHQFRRFWRLSSLEWQHRRLCAASMTISDELSIVLDHISQTILSRPSLPASYKDGVHSILSSDIFSLLLISLIL